MTTEMAAVSVSVQVSGIRSIAHTNVNYHIQQNIQGGKTFTVFAVFTQS